MISSDKLNAEQKYLLSQINLKNARILQLKRNPEAIDTIVANNIAKLQEEVKELQQELND